MSLKFLIKSFIVCGVCMVAPAIINFYIPVIYNPLNIFTFWGGMLYAKWLHNK